MADALHERERTIKASRGEIVDRNGIVIAGEPDGLHGVRDPQSGEGAGESDPGACADPGSFRGGSPEKKWKSGLPGRSSGRMWKSRWGDEIMNLGLSGVKVDEDYRRYYPYGSLASKVLGFTGADNQGIIGLEVMYEKYLKGTGRSDPGTSDAKRTELQNAAEERVETISRNTLTVSLDVNIQKYAEQAAYQVMEKKVQRRSPSSS